jgi:hypothetical protein
MEDIPIDSAELGASLPAIEEVKSAKLGDTAGGGGGGGGGGGAVPLENTEFSSSLPDPEEIKSTVHPRREKNRTCLWLGAGIFLLVVTVLGILIGISKSRGEDNNNDNNNKSDVSAVNRSASTSDVIRYLVDQGISTEEDLRTGTPQFRAAAWLATEDEANLAVPIAYSKDDTEGYLYMCRYVMALNYFAMGGHTHWRFQLGFLGKRSVCGWQGEALVNTGFIRSGVFCGDTAMGHVPTDLFIGKRRLLSLGVSVFCRRRLSSHTMLFYSCSSEQSNAGHDTNRERLADYPRAFRPATESTGWHHTDRTVPPVKARQIQGRKQCVERQHS